MRDLVVSTFVSLDGVMQAPGGPEEDTSNGFQFGGWTVPYFDETVGEFMDELMSKPFDLVLGRRTYDLFAAFWPNATEEQGAKPLNEANKYVASRGNPNLTWDRSHHISGDVVEGIRKLKQEDGPELQVHGSGNLLQTLMQSDVIDRFRILTFPVLLGSGHRLFESERAASSLTLRKSTTSSTGVTMCEYLRAGAVRTGSFA